MSVKLLILIRHMHFFVQDFLPRSPLLLMLPGQRILIIYTPPEAVVSCPQRKYNHFLLLFPPLLSTFLLIPLPPMLHHHINLQSNPKYNHLQKTTVTTLLQPLPVVSNESFYDHIHLLNPSLHLLLSALTILHHPQVTLRNPPSW